MYMNNNRLNNHDTLYARYITPASNSTVIDTTDEDEEELVSHFLWMIVDESGSVAPLRRKVYQQIKEIFEGLSNVNRASVDTRNLVKLAKFNSKLTEFNDVHMDPAQLLDTLTESDYQPEGTTSDTAVSQYIDKELNGKSAVVRKLRKNTPKFTFVIITDARFNDPADVRQKARRILESNHYYKKYCRVLVIYLGDDADKASAVALANGIEENVVAIRPDMTELLAPVIIGSTVTFPDGTHMDDSDGTQTIADLTDQIDKRNQDGSSGAKNLTDEQLQQELSKLLGKTGS